MVCLCVCVTSVLHEAGNLDLLARDPLYPLSARISFLSALVKLLLLLLRFHLDLYWNFCFLG